MATTTNLSLHLITSITAAEPGGFGDPLVLRLNSRYGNTHITLFFDVGDTGLTKRLVEAINTAAIGPILPPPEAACPHEAAAYAAASYAYSGGAR